MLSKSLMQQKEKESHFLEQLLDPHKINDYRLPIPVNAELRKYQQVCCILYSRIVCVEIYTDCTVHFVNTFYTLTISNNAVDIFTKYVCHQGVYE